MYRLLFFLLFISQCIYCQPVKIVKVIDSNLFELKDGRLIKLAGIDMPRLDHPDYLLRKTARDAVSYIRQKMLSKRYDIKVINQLDTINLVYLIEKFPLGDKLNNSTLLREGFGKFINNIDSIYVKKFLDDEQLAKHENRGIWKLLEDEDSGLLDRQYSEGERTNPALTDSLEYLIATTPEPNVGTVAGQLILGPAVGMITGVATGALSWGILASDKRGEFAGFGEFFLGWYAGYLIGNAICINAIAGTTTKEPNIWGTLLSSFIGGGIGIGAALLADNSNNSGARFLYTAPLILPTVASVIYVNSMAPDKFYADQPSAYKELFETRSLTASQIYNSSMLFTFEVLRIQL